MLWKETAAVRLLSLRIPLLLFVGPRVLELDDEGAAVGVPLGWRTKNHVGSMYVGVMAAAADLASGMNAFSLIRSRYRRVVPVFKYANMEFLKRADGYTVFRTRRGAAHRRGHGGDRAHRAAGHAPGGGGGDGARAATGTSRWPGSPWDCR